MGEVEAGRGGWERCGGRHIDDGCPPLFLEKAVALLEKGRLAMMYIGREDSSEAKDWERIMTACLPLIRGGKQALTMDIVERMNERGGYPF